MSQIKANAHQVGQSASASQNFTIYQPATPDGTMRVGVGNAGATTADAVTVSSLGRVGIGTAAPDVMLELSKANTTGNVEVRCKSTAAGGAYIDFGTHHSGASHHIWGTGNIPLVMATNGVERARIAADGSQSSVIPGGATLYPEFKCRAWINMNGTSSPVTVRGSGNISSVTKVAVGEYTLNFATALPDTNFAAAFGNGGVSTGYAVLGSGFANTVSTFRFTTWTGFSAKADAADVFVSIFR